VNETDLEALRAKVDSLSPSDQLRLAADMLEWIHGGKMSQHHVKLVRAIVERIAGELATVELLQRAASA
jgi:hypothetical protein